MRPSSIALAAAAYLGHAVVACQWGHRIALEGRDAPWLLLVLVLWSLAVGLVVAGLIVERDRRRAAQDMALDGEEDEDEDPQGRVLH